MYFVALNRTRLIIITVCTLSLSYPTGSDTNHNVIVVPESERGALVRVISRVLVRALVGLLLRALLRTNFFVES